MRLAIVAHFDRNNQVEDWFLQYIRTLLERVDRCVVVSTAALSAESQARIRSTGAIVEVRLNEGLDFCSWRRALEILSGDLKSADELIMCNDSVFAPVAPFWRMFDLMDQKRPDLDIWGITENFQIRRHIQSYFVVFRKRALSSPEFSEFWNGVKVLSLKDEIIRRYEVGLSAFFESRGFRLGAFYQTQWLGLIPWYLKRMVRLPFVGVRSIFRATFARYPKNQNVPTDADLADPIDFGSRLLNYFFVNPTHFEWKNMLRSGVPIIKADLLRDNPQGVLIQGWQREVDRAGLLSSEMIESCLKRIRR